MSYGLEMACLLVLVLLQALFIAIGATRAATERQNRLWKWAGIASVVFSSMAMFVSPYGWEAASVTVFGQYLRAASFFWALFAPYSIALYLFSNRQPVRLTGRRAALRSLVVLPLAVAGYGVFIGRRDFQVREVRAVFPGLPPGLDGMRIVQISDIHYGPFLTANELRRVVGMANDLDGDLIAVTGDFITRTPEMLDECLNQMRDLRGRGPIFGCLGNHEDYAKCGSYTAGRAAAMGWRILRHESAPAVFGGAPLLVTGVDYEWDHRTYCERVEPSRHPGMFNLLLAHNPSTFPAAAAKGFDLTLSGHTHGGQIGLGVRDQHLNIVRAFTPFTNGLYALGEKKCFVTSGVGTIGVPLRIGAPPEVALIRLCAS